MSDKVSGAVISSVCKIVYYGKPEAEPLHGLLSAAVFCRPHPYHTWKYVN